MKFEIQKQISGSCDGNQGNQDLFASPRPIIQENFHLTELFAEVSFVNELSETAMNRSDTLKIIMYNLPKESLVQSFQ